MKDILRKDKASFGKIYGKIPDAFYDIAGFVIVNYLILLLFFEEVNRATAVIDTKYNLYSMQYYLAGALGEIFAVIYIGSLFYKKEKFSLKNVIKTNIWDIALLLMFIWSVISTYLAENNYIAVHGTDYRRDGLYTYILYAAMYVSAKAVSSREFKIWTMRILSVVCSALSLITVFQYNSFLAEKFAHKIEIMNKYTLYAATFNNTNHYAYLLTMALMALAGLVILEKKFISKLFFLVLFGFNMWALLINNTFGCYLAVVFGIIFAGTILIIKNKKNAIPVLAIVLIFVAVSAWVNSQTNCVLNNFGITYSDAKAGASNDAGGSSRIGLWKQGLKYATEKPVFGFGPDGLYCKYYQDGFFNDRPHNEYLQHAIFLGIPGILYYLTALISMFIYCIRRIKKLDSVVLVLGGVVFAYCFSAFFGNTMYYTTPYFFMFLGMLSACHRKENNEIQG